MLGNPVKKTCPECGREFTHPAAYANHAKVCGKVRAPLTPQPLLCCPMLCSTYKITSARGFGGNARQIVRRRRKFAHL